MSHIVLCKRVASLDLTKQLFCRLNSYPSLLSLLFTFVCLDCRFPHAFHPFVLLVGLNVLTSRAASYFGNLPFLGRISCPPPPHSLKPGNDDESTRCRCSTFSLSMPRPWMMCRRKDKGKKWREASIMRPRYGRSGASWMSTGALQIQPPVPQPVTNVVGFVSGCSSCASDSRPCRAP